MQKLNKRQEKILSFILKQKKVNNLEIVTFLGNKVSRFTILRDLDFLLKEKIVKRDGRGRNVSYSLLSNSVIKKGFLPKIISEEVFKKEIELCKKLNKENGGKCCWGTCDNCGVIPCLYKLYKGEVIDNKSEIKELKKNLMKDD